MQDFKDKYVNIVCHKACKIGRKPKRQTLSVSFESLTSDSRMAGRA